LTEEERFRQMEEWPPLPDDSSAEFERVLRSGRRVASHDKRRAGEV